MELVFIHGWGFDPHFWDALAPLLPSFKQHRVNLGFYGEVSEIPATSEPAVLIGHSYGFMHGMNRKQNWHRWIAINGFPRFIRGEIKPGCTSEAELRELKFGLTMASEKALEIFYDRIEAYPPQGVANVDRLRDGLDELRDTDLEKTLEALDTPGLVLAARNDPFVPPKTSEALCGVIQHGSIKWHETAGHALPVRDPEWCAHAIESFLA